MANRINAVKCFVVFFDLPKNLIATHPTSKRDQCKLLVYDRQSQGITHATFDQLDRFLKPSDHLVLNDAKVSPRRIYWISPKGRREEIVFLKLLFSAPNMCAWEVVLSGKKLKKNFDYAINPDISFQLIARHDKLAHIRINQSVDVLETYFQSKGKLPIPPYILKARDEIQKNGNHLSESVLQDYDDLNNYQTVYARHLGAVAAPTAGLHFTKSQITQLEQMGIRTYYIFLEVGWGTFAPVTQSHFESKALHAENLKMDGLVAQALSEVKSKHERIVSVGTTVVRTLETWGQAGMPSSGLDQATSLFIYPPYDFQVVDALITNFHLPGSSLLFLVSAFLGKGGSQALLNIYEQAIKREYRFYSYGDAMLIL